MSIDPRNMPPWLQEQLGKLQQVQGDLQNILAQKQHIESERIETDRALEELKKAGEGDDVFKHAGSILIKSTKVALVAELEEKKELATTRSTVLGKQETRLRESLKEQEEKVTKMITDQSAKGGGPAGPPPQPHSPSQL